MKQISIFPRHRRADSWVLQTARAESIAAVAPAASAAAIAEARGINEINSHLILDYGVRSIRKLDGTRARFGRASIQISGSYV